MKVSRFLIRFFYLALPVIIVSFGVTYYLPDLPADRVTEEYRLEDSRFIEVNGHRIHYRRKGTGETLVLVHGFGGNLRNWEEWYDLLSDDLDVVCMDLPGYGLTGPAPHGDHSDSAQVAFLDAFLTGMDINRFYLAGNSMGGAIAWKYALEYPQKVEKLLLLNAAGYPDPTKKEAVLGFRLLKNGLFKHLAMRITPKFVVQRSLQRIFADQELGKAESADVYIALMRREGNRKVLVERINGSFWDRSEEIKNISQPTLIMWGDKDVVIDVRLADLFDKDIANSKLIIYENAGHVPMKELPERSVADALAFLRDTGGSSSPDEENQ